MKIGSTTAVKIFNRLIVINSFLENLLNFIQPPEHKKPHKVRTMKMLQDHLFYVIINYKGSSFVK